LITFSLLSSERKSEEAEVVAALSFLRKESVQLYKFVFDY